MEKRILGRSISKTARLMGNNLSQKFHEAGLDITKEQWYLLNVLEEQNGMNQQDIAGLCEKDKTSVARQLDVMERKDLIVRTTDKLDKRIKRVQLTNKARELRVVCKKIASKTLDELTYGITAEDIDITIDVLEKISARLHKK